MYDGVVFRAVFSGPFHSPPAILQIKTFLVLVFLPKVSMFGSSLVLERMYFPERRVRVPHRRDDYWLDNKEQHHINNNNRQQRAVASQTSKRLHKESRVALEQQLVPGVQ